MKISWLLPVMLCVFSSAAYAQSISSNPCADAKMHNRPLAAHRGTIADQREENYDVKYVKLDVALNNLESTVAGNGITVALAKTQLNEYVFELAPELIIDSVKINGLPTAFTHAGNVGVVLFGGTPITAGTLFETQVFYHGSIPSGTSGINRGLRNVYSGAAQRWYTYTLGESYQARDWWPCKQSLQDKIDSADIWITVPDTLMAGSNGLLQQANPIVPGFKRYEWKNRNPIDYYLISASVGKYTEYAYYMHFSNSTDSMLMQNYIYPNTLAIRKPILDSTALMINHFSTIFGRYPFWKEKYGHCQAPFGGGEEHQTMTTLGAWDNEVVPHELAHQWFGDHVTCGTWKDIWLNEGFASYAEYLFIEYFKGNAAAKSKIAAVHGRAMFDRNSIIPNPAGSVYVDDTASEARIFDSRLTYNKGSAIVHTLRFEANDDALFFTLLKTYQTQFANSTATTAQFAGLTAQVYGRNMDTFFNQWIYSTGWPVYNATWNQNGNSVFLKLDQQATGNYTANKYSTPLEVKFTSPQGDTTIRIQTNDQLTSFTFSIAKTITNVVIDPNDWLLDGPGSILRDNNLALSTQQTAQESIYPNPVNDFLSLKVMDADNFVLSDLEGRIKLSQKLDGKVERVDVRSLTPGIYFYTIYKKGSIVTSGKVQKN